MTNFVSLGQLTDKSQTSKSTVVNRLSWSIGAKYVSFPSGKGKYLLSGQGKTQI